MIPQFVTELSSGPIPRGDNDEGTQATGLILVCVASFAVLFGPITFCLFLGDPAHLEESVESHPVQLEILCARATDMGVVDGEGEKRRLPY